MADPAIHREPWRPKALVYIVLRCPRCGKEYRTLPGSQGWCPHFDKAGRPTGVEMEEER